MSGLDTTTTVDDHALVANDDTMRPDIAAAWSRLVVKTGKKRDVRKLPEYLNEGETVIAMAGGATGGNLGLLVATNRRALFISEGIVNHSFEDFPYDRITTVSSSRSLMTAKVSIHTGGAARVVEQVNKGEAEMVAGIIRERVEAVTRTNCFAAPQFAASDRTSRWAVTRRTTTRTCRAT